MTSFSHKTFLIQLYYIISDCKATSEAEKEHHNQKLKKPQEIHSFLFLKCIGLLILYLPSYAI